MYPITYDVLIDHLFLISNSNTNDPMKIPILPMSFAKEVGKFVIER